MHDVIEKLACAIGEGFQTSSLNNPTQSVNVFHRTVTTHETSDLSFINGLVSTGLRGSAIISGEKIAGNYNQLINAARQHLPLVVNTSLNEKSGGVNDFSQIHAVQQTDCFQLVASSPQQEVYLTLIAHRIAELALIPGIVIANYDSVNDEVNIPEDKVIIQYLGNPDDQIECPTPSQEIIFGRTRRRIPNWFSFDLPAILGSAKDGEALSFEHAANQKYFYEHLSQLIKQAFSEFKEITDIDLVPVETHGKSTDYAIITIGGRFNTLLDQPSESNTNTEIININQLSPFPIQELTSVLKDKKAITILENTNGSVAPSSFYYHVLNSLNSTQTQIYSGQHGDEFNSELLEKAIQYMVSNQSKKEYFLGIDFTKPTSNYPKHEILLQEIEKQYPGITEETIATKSSNDHNTLIASDEIPMAVRMYQDHGPNYSRLSRFYDNTAFFYEHHEYGELVADPFNAISIIPAASASLFSSAQQRDSIPILDPIKCTGCGDCFVHCPHSALPSIAIGIEQLMKAGADIVTKKGQVITKLTPMIKNLAKVAIKTINENEITIAEDFLPSAFEDLANQMNLEGEKLDTVQSEFNAVLDAVSELPISITDHFFNSPELQEAGSGELFSIAINPSSCTGCSICAQVCPEDAFNMVPQNDENLTKTKEQYKLWERLPDTSGDTITRLFHDETYSSLAAMLLSRSYYMTMTGADSSEKDNPYKALIHIVTASVESVVQPKVFNQIGQIDKLINSLSENIHNKLSNALPKENLDGLSKSLKQAHGRKLSIQDMITKIAEFETTQFVDSEDLERKTDLVDDLKKLKWTLSEGPTGVGRARYGLIIAGSNSMDWAKQYPSNHFTSPCVIHWNGSAPEQTLGLFYGQLRYLLDNIKLMRRAALESKDKYDSAVHDSEIAILSWKDLSDEEKQMIPPILLIAERDDLNDSGWSSLNKLLSEKYPVKVILLDHIAPPNQSPIRHLAQTNAGMFGAIVLKNTFVFQGGMGNIDHLFDGLIDGLDRIYPALFNLYATKLEKHGSVQMDWSPFATLALNCRAHPALRFDPGEKSNFLSGAIRLDGNNSTDLDWVEEEITIDEEETINYKISWADWAFTQKEWMDQFALIDDDSSNVLVPDFVQIDSKSRKGKTPVIMRSGENGFKYYSVSDNVVEMTEAVLSNWNTLQEVAGLLTEFPLKLRETVTTELNNQFEQDTAELKKDFERQLKEQEATQSELLRQKLKEKTSRSFKHGSK